MAGPLSAHQLCTLDELDSPYLDTSTPSAVQPVDGREMRMMQ